MCCQRYTGEGVTNHRLPCTRDIAALREVSSNTPSVYTWPPPPPPRGLLNPMTLESIYQLEWAGETTRSGGVASFLLLPRVNKNFINPISRQVYFLLYNRYFEFQLDIDPFFHRSRSGFATFSSPPYPG